MATTRKSIVYLLEQQPYKYDVHSCFVRAVCTSSLAVPVCMTTAVKSFLLKRVWLHECPTPNSCANS
mgnify:FL=1